MRKTALILCWNHPRIHMIYYYRQSHNLYLYPLFRFIMAELFDKSNKLRDFPIFVCFFSSLEFPVPVSPQIFNSCGVNLLWTIRKEIIEINNQQITRRTEISEAARTLGVRKAALQRLNKRWSKTSSTKIRTRDEY